MKKRIYRVFSLVMSLALLAAMAFPVSVYAASSNCETIDLDNFTGESWSGGEGDNWTYSLSANTHEFTITGNVSIVGSCTSANGISFNIVNSDVTMTWAASYTHTSSGNGTAVSVSGSGRFEMTGGSITADAADALRTSDNAMAVIYAGTLSPQVGEAYAVRSSDNAIVLINNAAAYTGNLYADADSNSVILTYNNDIYYHSGDSDGIGLASKGSLADEAAYSWDNANGVSGIAVSWHEYSRFVPITSGVTVSAAPANSVSITIKRGSTDNSSWIGKTFNAYKIFDIVGGAYTASAEFANFDNYPNSATVLLKDYIDSLAGQPDEMNELMMNIWDYIVMNNILATGSQTATEIDSVTISNLPNGSYLVFALPVSGDVSIVANVDLSEAGHTASIILKDGMPTLTKEVWNKHLNAWASWSSANIGNNVNYRMTSAVPETTGYESYTFIVHSTLAAGLTFNSGSDSVRINGVTITAGVDYNLIENPADGDSFDVIFNPDIFAYYDIDDEIEITYSATLNTNAVIGVPGNMSDAYLEYSNDFAVGITDRTLKSRTTVYTFDLDIYKYTGTLGTDDIMLANAEFELRTNPSNPATAIAFVLDGTGGTEDTAVYRHAAPTDTGVTKILITPESGRLNLTGLDAGIYYLVETKAPEGYNPYQANDKKTTRN